MNSEEQITIQLGSYSCFVGTHFWNFQDEINRRRVHEEREDNYSYELCQLYRVGNADSERPNYTPRALMVDRRGTLGTLNPHKSEGGFGEAVDTWQGAQNIVKGEAAEKNDFLKMLEKTAMDNYSWGNPPKQYGYEEDEDGYDNREEEEEEAVAVKDSDVNVWSDFLKTPLQPSSVHELPFWPISEPFDTFGAGMSQDVVPVDNREMYFDVVRRYAEECDFLRNITIIADLFDGFGGLTCSLAQEIRDEMPRVTMPVWAITDRGQALDGEDDSCSIHNQLQRCNVPLAYSSLVGGDICTLMVPLCPSAARGASPFLDLDLARDYHTSAVLAAAIEVATGNNRLSRRGVVSGSADDSSSASESRGGCPLEFAKWASDVTGNYQRKLCSLEVCLPFPILSDYVPPSASASTDLQSVLTYEDHLGPLWSAIGRSSSAQGTSAAINPFMASLSSSVHGLWAAPREKLLAVRQGRPLSNVLHCRGFDNTDLSVHLFDCARRSQGFMVTNICQQTSMLPLPLTFPEVFRGVDSKGFVAHESSLRREGAAAVADVLFPPPRRRLISEESRRRERASGASRMRCNAAAVMTGMGVDDGAMAGHVGAVRSSWRERGVGCNAQLAKTGIGNDECQEVEENLFVIEERFIAQSSF